jgi:parallel beta-helix repeat protein
VDASEASGIYVEGPGSAVIGNTCIGNNVGNGANTAGIYIVASNNRIEDNHVTATLGAGIQVASGLTNNVIIKNSVIGNGANNYIVPAGNDLGPVGTATNSTSPWANISH